MTTGRLALPGQHISSSHTLESVNDCRRYLNTPPPGTSLFPNTPHHTPPRICPSFPVSEWDRPTRSLVPSFGSKRNHRRSDGRGCARSRLCEGDRRWGRTCAPDAPASPIIPRAISLVFLPHGDASQMFNFPTPN